MKNIGPCRILRKFAANTYKIELPDNVGISPIFNVAYVYIYKEDAEGGLDDQRRIKWEKKFL
jgi:hypothetical protein